MIWKWHCNWSKPSICFSNCRITKELLIILLHLKKALTFVLSPLLFTATVLRPEYHSSSAALGQQHPEVTRQSLVCDWLATSEVLCDVNLRFAQYTEERFVQGVKQWQWKAAGHHWSSTADKEWYSIKRPSSTVAVNSNELNTRWVPFSIVYSISARWNCLFLPPVVPYVELDGTASVYALHETRWQLALLWWTFPVLRCSYNVGVVKPSLSLSI